MSGWKVFDPNSHAREPVVPLTATVVTNAVETVDLNKWRTTAAFKVNGVEYTKAQCYERSLTFNPENSDAWHNLGLQGGGWLDAFRPAA